MNENIKEYVAFISYRHTEPDKEVAKKVHTLIEHYQVPKEMQAEWGGKKLGKVFRDEEELPVASNLTENIQTALDHSKFLIVVCTPNTPKSIWVEREISYFLSHHDREHVVGILVDGTPDDAFPHLLTNIYDEEGNKVGEIEPLAANLTGVDHKYVRSRLRREVVRLYAAIMQCPFDSLWQRERRYRLRSAVALLSLVLAVSLAFCVSILLKNKEITARNMQIEEQNAQIQEQNEAIVAQYEEIQKMNYELQKNDADTLIREGELLYEKGNTKLAGERAKQAVASQAGMDWYRGDAEYLIYRAKGAGEYDNTMRTTAVIEQDEDIENLLVSQDGKRVYTMNSRGYVGCYDAEDAKLIWSGNADGAGYVSYDADRQRLCELPETGILLCCNEDFVTALSLENGSRIWSHEEHSGRTDCDFAVLTPDQKSVVLFSAESILSPKAKLLVLDVLTGAQKQEIELPTELADRNMVASGSHVATFSKDGKEMISMVFLHTNYVVESGYALLRVDFEKGTAQIIAQEEMDGGYGSKTSSFTIGLHEDQKTGMVLALYYDSVSESVKMKRIENGSVTTVSEIPITLPNKDMSDPYVSTYAPSENGIALASCGEISMIYSLSTGELVDAEKYSVNNVLHTEWMDESNYTRSFLTDNGTNYALYYTAGLAVATFADKIHITKLDITPGYAINHGKNGYLLRTDAAMAVVCDDNATRAYIMHPAKDPTISEVDWDFLTEDMIGSLEGVSMLDESTLVLGTNKADGKISISLVDVPTGTLKGQYDIDPDAYGDFMASSYFLNALYWKDGEHFSYIWGLDHVEIGSLKKSGSEPVFGENRAETVNAIRMTTGEVLETALVTTGEFSGTEPGLTIMTRIEDGEVRRFDASEGKKLAYRENYLSSYLFCTGESGYVVAGEFLQENGNAIDSFLVCNALTGASYELTDEAHGKDSRIASVGSKNGFAVVDPDAKIRIYDLEKKALKQTIPLAVQERDVLYVAFCNEDKGLLVWTGSRTLLVYDTESGEELFRGQFEHDNAYILEASEIRVTEAPAQNRVYFTTANGSTICVDTRNWTKTGDFYGMEAYCPATNEIFRIKNKGLTFQEETNGLLRYRARTLEDFLKE